MTTESLSRGTAETIARIIWLCVASPRQAVRELLSAADVRTLSLILVSLGIAISSISGGIAEWLILRKQFDPDHFIFFGPGQAIAEAGAWTLFQVIVGVLCYPLTALLWMHVFGFRDKVGLVWAAVATTYGLFITADPVLNIVSHFTDTPEGIEPASWIALAVYSAFVIALSSYYFVEALSIGLLRAVLINSAVFAMLIVGIIIVALFLYWFFGLMVYEGIKVPS